MEIQVKLTRSARDDSKLRKSSAHLAGGSNERDGAANKATGGDANGAPSIEHWRCPRSSDALTFRQMAQRC